MLKSLYEYWLITLTFPPLPTFKTRDKCRHGFIGRTRLKLCVCAFVRLACATREQVGRRLDFKLILVLVAILLVFDDFGPHFRIHVLVRHKCKFVRFDFFWRKHVHNIWIIKVNNYAFQPVNIHLNKICIVPFFHNIHLVCFLQCPIVNPLL